MSTPKIAGTQPAEISLKKGNHAWCACGESKSQPFCDGSHRGTGFAPLVFAVAEEKKAYVCMCKRTKSPPYCDGSHQQLGDDRS